jgi:hypothetical protein
VQNVAPLGNQLEISKREFMPRKTLLTRTAICGLASLASVSIALAQEPAPTKAPEAEQKVDADELKLPEAEFVGSTSFRSAALVEPLWGQLAFDGHYFGGLENNIGYTAASWTFHSKHWTIAPGAGVLFGDNGFRTMPAVSVRWEYERGWFITEGLFLQGLLRTKFIPEGTEAQTGEARTRQVFPSIADGNHVSARWKRFTAGGLWEHEEFREGREWKGGVRVAYRALRHLSFTFFALGPDSEIRGGVLFEPEEK